ncbi:MAG: hypothetical protein WAM14_10705 [Candidatus Nitrosopolaris sp.]
MKSFMKTTHNKKQYRRLLLLVHTGDKLLEQIDEELGKFALQKLKAKGVEFI